MTQDEFRFQCVDMAIRSAIPSALSTDEILARAQAIYDFCEKGYSLPTLKAA